MYIIDIYVAKSIIKSMATDKRNLILRKAMEVFQKHGYKRVNMTELAEALNISRPGLYLYYKTKEDIFCAVVREFGKQTIERAATTAARQTTVRDKLHAVFEVFFVEIFSMTEASLEIKEVSESSFEFARDAVDETFKNCEELIVGILHEHGRPLTGDISFVRCAHLLVSATRGFKLVAKRPSDLRKMIHLLLQLTLGL